MRYPNEQDSILVRIGPASCVLLYAMFNAMISVSAENIDKYWQHAIPMFFGLMLVLSLLAMLFSGFLRLDLCYSYLWLFGFPFNGTIYQTYFKYRYAGRRARPRRRTKKRTRIELIFD